LGLCYATPSNSSVAAAAAFDSRPSCTMPAVLLHQILTQAQTTQPQLAKGRLLYL